MFFFSMVKLYFFRKLFRNNYEVKMSDFPGYDTISFCQCYLSEFSDGFERYGIAFTEEKK